MKRQFLAIALMASALTGCVAIQPSSAPAPTPAPAATATQPSPTPAETATPQTTEQNKPQDNSILFQDDFSDPASGWLTTTTDYGEFAYTDGAYHIHLDK